MEITDIKTRDIHQDDIKNPQSLNTVAVFGFHRTSKWMFVEYYEIRHHGIHYRRYADPKSPIYTAEGFRGDRQQRIILQPCHPKKNLRFFYAIDNLSKS